MEHTSTITMIRRKGGNLMVALDVRESPRPRRADYSCSWFREEAEVLEKRMETEGFDEKVVHDILLFSNIRLKSNGK